MVGLCGLLDLRCYIHGIAQYREFDSSRIPDEAPVNLAGMDSNSDAHRRIEAAFDVPLINVAKQANGK